MRQTVLYDGDFRIALKRLPEESLVAIFGYRDADGNAIATYAEPLKGNFVEGSTDVYINGIVTREVGADGTLIVGDLVVDVTAIANYQDVRGLAIGSQIEITQKLYGKTVQYSGGSEYFM